MKSKTLYIDAASESFTIEDVDALGPLDFGIKETEKTKDSFTFGSGALVGSYIPGTKRLIFFANSPSWEGPFISTMGGAAEIFHKTPFGMKAGKRSLYYHARNYWLYAFKNCSWSVVFSSALTLSLKGIGLKRSKAYSRDATGTIGLEHTLKNTEGGYWIAIKATIAAFVLLPYCLSKRKVCRSPDFKPPVM